MLRHWPLTSNSSDRIRPLSRADSGGPSRSSKQSTAADTCSLMAYASAGLNARLAETTLAPSPSERHTSVTRWSALTVNAITCDPYRDT